MFALVDCNNFYVSCERVFDPRLKQRTVAVLSNNDGCIVARSPEVKALGIAMGTPLFRVRELVQTHAIAVLSSNYALYGDMSARVMSVLADRALRVEVYSIDEAFLELPGGNPLAFGEELRARVKQWTGIPVSIGIAPTKVLAKLANRAAKRTDAGVAIAPDDAQLAATAVEDLWGISSRWGKRLRARGLCTALALRDAPEAAARGHGRYRRASTARTAGSVLFAAGAGPAPQARNLRLAFVRSPGDGASRVTRGGSNLRDSARSKAAPPGLFHSKTTFNVLSVCPQRRCACAMLVNPHSR